MKFFSLGEFMVNATNLEMQKFVTHNGQDLKIYLGYLGRNGNGFGKFWQVSTTPDKFWHILASFVNSLCAHMCSKISTN